MDEEVEEARYENGNGGYTGSFAEKDGLTIKTTVHADYDSAMEELENNPKWGNAWAVPYNAKVIIPKQNLSKKKESLDKVLKELEQLKTDGYIALGNLYRLSGDHSNAMKNYQTALAEIEYLTFNN